MRETPKQFAARTGKEAPMTDVSVAGAALATTVRPLVGDEACPTLYRDIGPQALMRFLDGKLDRLAGPKAPCVFMRDATLPGFTGVVRELGVLVFLQPLAIGPWVSGQPGIYVAETGLMPPAPTLGFVPRAENLPEVDAQIANAPDASALREALGGARYDEQVTDVRGDLGQYLEIWRALETEAAPWRALVGGHREATRIAALEVLRSEGLTEQDLHAPLFSVPKARRAELAARMVALSAKRAQLEAQR